MAGGPEEPKLDTASITAGVVAVLGVVASLTAAGAIQRVLRNHPWWFVGVLALVLIGGLLWLLAALVGEGAKRWLRILGAGAIAAGAFGAMWVTARTANDAERPAISAAFDPDTQRFKATVTAGNLGSNETIVVAIDGLGEGPPRSLSQNYSGPDGDGKVEMNLDIPVPPGPYDRVGVRAWSRETPNCGLPNALGDAAAAIDEQSEKSGAACAIVPVPVARPSVTAAWEGAGRKQESVSISASVAKVRSRVLAIDITVRRSKGTVERLKYVVSGPGNTGKAATTTRIAVPRDARRVCAEVRLQPIPAARRRKPTCPLPATVVHAAEYDGAYAELRPTRDR